MEIIDENVGYTSVDVVDAFVLSYRSMIERQLENRTQLSVLTIISVTAFNYCV